VRESHHEAIAKWERRWLSASGVLSLLFILLIAYSLAVEGAHIAQQTTRTTPDRLLENPLFASPGVRALGPGRYQVAAVAQAFNFMPEVIRLPVGAEVEFYLTSRDVLHGYQIENTTINVEVIPGEVSRFFYTFTQPGEYRVTCNQYCGIGHHNMMGKIIVVPTSQVVEPLSAAEVHPGEAVYQANCASCHQANGQGLAGAFPPLEGHAASLFNADGGREYLINLLLYGLQGQITADGGSYNGVMPAWGQLSDQQLADTLNYILSAWGNDARVSAEPDYQASDFAEKRGQDLSSNDIYRQRQALELR
jgi:cytochrome c oxidase subunit II